MWGNRYNFSGRGFGFAFDFRGHFRRYGLHYFFLCACFAAGVAIGCGTGASLTRTMTALDVNYVGMVRVLNVNMRFGTVFWNRLLVCAGFMLAVAFFGNFVFTLPFNYVLLILRGYLVGINFAVLITFFGVGGLISALVFVLPNQLILTCALCPLIAFSCSRRFQYRGYRGRVDFLFCLREFYPHFACAFLIVMVLSVVEALILPMFTAVAVV